MTYPSLLSPEPQILSLSPQPLNLPEPYQTKVRALLKPWHPFLLFDWKVLEEDLAFSISARNLLCRDVWLRDALPRFGISGMYPLEAFADPAEGYARFEGHVFRCLVQLIGQLASPVLAGMPLVQAGRVDWFQVKAWLLLLTDPLSSWFDRGLRAANGCFEFVVGQPCAQMNGVDGPGWLCLDTGGQIRRWHRTEETTLICLSQDEIQTECWELAQAQGDDYAATLLHKLLIERIANALYFMRFSL